MSEHLFNLCEINIICGIILLILWQCHRQNSSAGTAGENVLGKAMLSGIGVCVCDILAALLNGRSAFVFRALLYLFNAGFYALTIFITFFLTIYVFAQIGLLSRIDWRGIVLLHLPLFLFLFLLVISAMNGWIFRITPEGVYERGPMVWLHWVTAAAYFLIPAAVGIASLLEEPSVIRRGEIFPLMGIFLCPAVAAILQVVYYGLTVLQCGFTIAILVVFCSTQNTQIQKDLLTGLNNRRAFQLYERANLLRENGVQAGFLMIGLEESGRINDIFGHIEGDQAVRRISEVVRMVLGRAGAGFFLCRFAADRFLIVGKEKDRADMEELHRALIDELLKLNDFKAKRFDISISIGESCGITFIEADVEKQVALAEQCMLKGRREKQHLRIHM